MLAPGSDGRKAWESIGITSPDGGGLRRVVLCGQAHFVAARSRGVGFVCKSATLKALR